MMRPRLFGMITTGASISYTVEALRTFFLYTELRDCDHFVLIDNDGSWSESTPFTHSAIKVQKNTQPLGYAANANLFVKSALSREMDLFILNNDLVFTVDWCRGLDESGLAVTCPFSNREVQYAIAIQAVRANCEPQQFLVPPEMNLMQYRGSEHRIQAIAEAHRAIASSGIFSRLVMPYFCVRIPLEILKAVGLFDESFGRAGAEDYDYSLRVYLAGFPVGYALRSWILHFYGKSSWSGVESSASKQERENMMLERFEQKWGSLLRELIFSEKESLITDNGFVIPSEIEEFANLIKALKHKGSVA